MSCRNLLPLQNKRGRGLWLCAYCEKLFLPLDGPGCKICSVPVKIRNRVVTKTLSPSLRAKRSNPEASERDESCWIASSLRSSQRRAIKFRSNSNVGVICSSCSTKTFHFTHNRAAFAYEDLVRDLIRDIKFRRRKHVAQGLGRLWGGLIAENFPANAVLAPLPMHPKKRRMRGFDQAVELAAALSAATGAALAPILERTKFTPPQSGLHPKQRAENVRGAFRIKPGVDVQGNTYILVDDIYTTGASLNECARILIAGGAKEVSAMTLAIAIKKDDDTAQTVY